MGFRESPIWISSLILFLIITNPSFTETSSNQSLHWGFEIGNQFVYRCSYKGLNWFGNGDFTYLVVIEELPDIYDNVTEDLRCITDLEREMSFCISFFDRNYTEVSFGWYTELFWSAYPIGNWSLVEESFLAGIDTTSTEVQFTESLTEWGFDYFEEEPGWMNTSQTYMYSKEDGVANSYEVEYMYVDGGVITFSNVRLVKSEDNRELLMRLALVGATAFSIGITITVLLLYWKGIDSKRLN